MAVGNTFGATALSSYGGFWLSFAIVLTPGGFQIQSTLGKSAGFPSSLGLFLMVGLTQRNHLPMKNTYANLNFLLPIGLVHFHNDSPVLHPEVHGGFLPPFLLPRPHLPAPRCRLHLPRQLGQPPPQPPDGGRSLRSPSCIRLVVQRPGRSCR